VLIASMAKGMGAPAAVLSGPEQEIAGFVRRSEVRIHTSPASSAALSAVSHALDLNAHSGADLRSRLLSNVDLFRRQLRQAGLHPKGGRFPVQVLSFRRSGEAAQAYQRLKDRGVSALLLAPHAGKNPDLCFCLRADHHPEAIVTASRLLTSS
jgi:8-amino-7-oxononanoate synthase